MWHVVEEQNQTLLEKVKAFEKELVTQLVREHKNLREAATSSGLDYGSFHRKVAKYGLLKSKQRKPLEGVIEITENADSVEVRFPTKYARVSAMYVPIGWISGGAMKIGGYPLPAKR